MGQDAEAAKRASLAGDVQCGFPVVVHQLRVTSCFQEAFSDLRLLRNDSQVERCLEGWVQVNHSGPQIRSLILQHT